MSLSLSHRPTFNGMTYTPTQLQRDLTPTALHSRSCFSTSTHHRKKRNPSALPPRPTLPDSDITHVYLKGSGPGGQKINKTNSAAQLTHLPTGIVVKSQATRSRSQNYTIARRILAEKVEVLEKGDESRVMKRQERDRRKKASSTKKKRRKYRALEKGDGQEGEEDDVGDGAIGPEREKQQALDEKTVQTGDGNSAEHAKAPAIEDNAGNPLSIHAPLKPA
ncbi:uncharacterized protein A1O9_03293 [Exophiala aquamarina CBS 119918]|uniref:Prokaryotic-type class I peptide chain release factors domain-containing protein n=1 Tax=Exophiala aquamarina CBS 119918 TaxID=1182545 RepID=A0A072PQX1_9EURO|nr:uncharacterized protein A1O9_03293 [Exophiala aquamarina CBS 119918]KEF61723.1 hypothetical protein A1O9_03293 [Exophiala aquamarina CBS 119918]